MKARDTAYLVESNRFVHEVEILRCNGELYIVCFKDNGVGLYFKAYHLLLTSWKTVKSISQAPEHTDRQDFLFSFRIDSQNDVSGKLTDHSIIPHRI